MKKVLLIAGVAVLLSGCIVVPDGGGYYGMGITTIIIIIGIEAGEGPDASIRTFAQSGRRSQFGMHQKDL